LITYATNAGSTAEVAEAIRETLAQSGAEVDVRRVDEVDSVEGYEAVVLGAPMIAGWHRGAVGFLKRHQGHLSKVPVALFITCISLTQTGESQVDGVPITVDPDLPKPPKQPGKLSFRERYATPGNYLRPVLKRAPTVRPVSVAFFAGKLELFRLNFFQMIFATLVTGGRAGDFRNWEAIRSWAAGLRLFTAESAEKKKTE
jgi:menaquinone-dependent protoporphyrinogen oxidase